MNARDERVAREVARSGFGGRKARRFRERWAAGALRSESTIRTITFPLQAPQGRVDHAPFAELHATLREIRPGTLGWLLLTAHSLGLRLFATSEDVTAFRNASLLADRDYVERLRSETGTACAKLGPAGLHRRFRRVPRPARGTTLPFTAESIAREYIRYFQRDMPGERDPVLERLMGELARRLERLGGWREIASAPERAFEAWDDVLRAEGRDLPALAGRWSSLAPAPQAVAKASIAFDPAKPRVTLPRDGALHLVVACALVEAREEGATEHADLVRRVLRLLLTDNYSGLSWLWGSGLRLLRSATAADCRAWFGIDLEAGETLVEAAALVPPDRVFGNDGYAAYRSEAGGALANSIAQHVGELVALERRLDQPGKTGPRAGVATRLALARLLGKVPGATEGDLRELDRSVPGRAAKSSPRGVGDEEDSDAARQLSALSEIVREHATRVFGWCRASGVRISPFDRLAEPSTRAPPSGAVASAVARVLDRFGKVARRQPAWIARRAMDLYQDLGVARRPRDLHRFFLARQGTLVFAFPQEPRSPDLAMAPELSDRREAVLPALERLVGELRCEVAARAFDARALTALLDLEHACRSSMLWGLPETVPRAVASPPAGAEPWIPQRLQEALRSDSIEGRTVRRLFDAYAAGLRGIAARLRPRRFSLRYAFTRARDNALLYVPKAVSWHPPDRLRRAAGPIGMAFDSMGCVDDGGVEPPLLLQRAARSFGRKPGIDAWLVQSPHDWCYAGLRGGAPATGLSMSKASVGRRTMECDSVFRLIGPSSRKTLLDEALIRGKGRIGDVKVMCSRQFVQEVAWTAGGAVSSAIRELGCSLELGVPVLESPVHDSRCLSMDRYLSVDLGETGFGWCAFDARSHRELASGFEFVPGTQSLGKHARGRGQSARIAGEFIHSIDRLLSRFRAFPVFGAPAGRGRTPFQRIRDRILETYSFVGKRSALERRKAHWCGGYLWEHPYLRRHGEWSGAAKPLKLFPGAVMSARGFERACSRCGRDAVAEIRAVARGAASNGTFLVGVGGTVAVSDGWLVLDEDCHPADPEVAAPGRARRPLRAGPIGAAGLAAAIEDNVRPGRDRAPRGAPSELYHCVYWDCGNRESLRINAARNLARRFRDGLGAEHREAPDDGEETTPPHSAKDTCSPIWTGT